MDTEKLNQQAVKFAEELRTSAELQSHVAEHQRRSQRAQALLALDHIPALTEAELRELFFDSDAFGFWRNKEWEFNKRLQGVGLEGLRRAVLELVTRAERGLTPDDLKQIWDMGGLGTLLVTELLAYRFPTRYWTFNHSVTLPAFQALGDDVKFSMPRGQKSDPYLYLTLESRVAQVRQALNIAGLAEADNLLADIFLWWIKKNASGTTPPEPPQATGIPEVDASRIEQALLDFDTRQRPQPEWADWESNRPHQYAILWQGKRYPVKEVVRMATGAADFVSTQARSYLQKRGFQVIALREESANVWLFQANPRIYDLETGLRRHQINDWQINRYRGEIRKGDRVVFWKSGDRRGIYGLGTIVSDQYQRDDGDWVADVRYDGSLRQPVLYESLREQPILSNMLIMRQQQGTNFRVTLEEWAVLQPLLGEIIPPDADAFDARGNKPGVKPDWNLLSLLGRSLAAQGLHFTPWQIATFYTGLQTKGFVILSGISGTGKTKLAQYFAEMLPQPAGAEISSSDESITITVQPYMLKYGRLIIPKQATRLFDPPAPGKWQDVQLAFDEQDQACRLVHASYGNSDYISLLLRGTARQWFGDNLSVGDTLRLEPEIADQNLTGFRLTTGPVQPEAAPRDSTARNWLFVPVRPDWRDSKSLLGYFNPLTGTYEWTPFLRFLLSAAHSYRAQDSLAWFVILDEMNLAHVEYYFADLLSVLESGRKEDGWTREPLRLIYPDEAEGDLPPRELPLPPNLYVIGTVNVDETTHAFSPKVLDRAFTLELTEADFSNYPPVPDEQDTGLDDEARQAILDNFTFSGDWVRVDKQVIAGYVAAHPEVRVRLQSLNEMLRPYDLHFGYRVFDEVISFLNVADTNKVFVDLDKSAAFDAAVLMKVLPKFHGSRGRLQAPLQAVLAWCVNPDEPAVDLIADALNKIESGDDVAEALGQIKYLCHATAERARRLLRTLYTDGFAAFG